MGSYILPIFVLSLGLGCWAVFQLWTGRQADGTSIDSASVDSEKDACGECEESCSTKDLYPD